MVEIPFNQNSCYVICSLLQNSAQCTNLIINPIMLEMPNDIPTNAEKSLCVMCG